MGRAVLQYSHCTSDMARRRGARRERAARRHCGASGCAAGTRGTGAGRAAWACCWAVGCVLGALSLFLTRFDSVLFLS